MSEEFQTWKHHFIQQAKGLIPHQKRFYKVSMQQGKGDQPTIKMVSPTEQVVERAKSDLVQPPSVYDPVTGVMQQTSGKHLKIPTPRKRKGGILKNKSAKKRRIVKKKKSSGKSRKGRKTKRVVSKKKKPKKKRSNPKKKRGHNDYI
ncbi:MAG: hypothetical protein N2B06_18590 [Clostridium sp.]